MENKSHIKPYFGGTTVRDSILQSACSSSNFAINFAIWTKLNTTGRFLQRPQTSVGRLLHADEGTHTCKGNG
jgi:hypothetical protein